MTITEARQAYDRAVAAHDEGREDAQTLATLAVAAATLAAIPTRVGGLAFRYEGDR